MRNIINKKYPYKQWVFKSKGELYMCLYLEVLQKYGYVISFDYESVKFSLSDSVYEEYLVKLITKNKTVKEHLMNSSSYQPDFVVHWHISAENLFYLNRTVPITHKLSEIPFRLGKNSELISYPEVKPPNESKLSSSVAFPINMKQVYKQYGIFVQKIIPYNPTVNGKSLFRSTFYPNEVIRLEKYAVNCAGGLKGSSKIKHKFKTIDEYLKERNYE